MQLKRLYSPIATGALAVLLALPAVAANNIVANPICPDNTANFNPTLPPSIDLPPGFTAVISLRTTPSHPTSWYSTETGP